MIGEVCFTRSVTPGDVGHEIIVHPESSHGVVHRRVDHHGCFIRILIYDLLIHLEEVAIFGFYDGLSQRTDLLIAWILNVFHDGIFSTISHDSRLEIEIDSFSGLVDSESCIATFLRSPRGYIPRDQVSEGGIPALQIVITVLFLQLGWLESSFTDGFGIFKLSGYPYPSIIPQGF